MIPVVEFRSVSKWYGNVIGVNNLTFRLRPGETRFLRLDFHTATCDPAGLQDGFSRIVSLPVRYRTLGVTRTATVPIDQVSVAIRTIGICDHPWRRL